MHQRKPCHANDITVVFISSIVDALEFIHEYINVAKMLNFSLSFCHCLHVVTCKLVSVSYYTRESEINATILRSSSFDVARIFASQLKCTKEPSG